MEPMLKKIIYIFHPTIMVLLVSCFVIAFFIVFDRDYRIAKGYSMNGFKGVVMEKYIARNTNTMLVIQVTEGISETENIERILLGKSGVERIVYIR
jgi:hypothetical protein